MNRPHLIRTSRDRRVRTRGYMLVELIITVALMAIVLNLATQVLARIFTTDISQAEDERTDVAIDRAVQRLRFDTERAAGISANDSTLTLGTVTWTAEPNVLVRRDSAGTDRFDDLSATPVLAVDGERVTLTIGKQAWTFASLVDGGGSR